MKTPSTKSLSKREVAGILSDRDPENKPGEMFESNSGDAEEAGESPSVERMEVEAADNGASVSTHHRQKPNKNDKNGHAVPSSYQPPKKKVFQNHSDFMKHVHEHTKGMFKGGNSGGNSGGGSGY